MGLGVMRMVLLWQQGPLKSQGRGGGGRKASRVKLMHELHE